MNELIPRWQRILFGVLLGSSVLMGVYLFHLHHKRREQLAARILKHRAVDLALSSITLAELTFGVENIIRCDRQM